jgi:multiple sugar transport system ATP-binding protein
MRAEIARIQRRLGVATLYVTHDQVEAMTMGDRVAVMRAGVLQQCDDPQALYDKPKNIFVAGFMGSPAMNFFEGTVGEGAKSVLIGSQTISLPETVHAARPALRAYAGRSVAVGIRPEDLPLLDPAKPTTDAGVFEGDIDLVEALGSERLVHFTTDANQIDISEAKGEEAAGLSEGTLVAIGGEGVARVDARAKLAAGSRARFHLDPERLHFFDNATSKAIVS